MGSPEESSFAQRFRVVARDRLATIRAHLGELARGTGTAHDAEELRREIHSLKGEARVVGFPAVAQALHALESEAAVEDALAPGSTLLASLPAELDAIDRLLDVREGGGPSHSEAPPDDSLERIARQAAESFLRVDLASLSLLGRAIGELRVGEAELARFVEHLGELAELARAEERGELDANSSMRLAIPLRQLATRARQIAFDQHARLDRLEDRIRSVRMVPLASLFEPFPRAARQLATELGKDVEIVVRGGAVEVDRQVLDVIAEPMLHLVRNAIDHGLETPEERRGAGKPPGGALTLSARAAGSAVIIEIADDGRGIDVASLEAALRERGEAHVDPAALDEAGLLELLCRHGLSTRRDVSEVSGRGVGLDVVKRRTESVGGRLSLRTAAGAGTTFTLEVPMSAVLATMLCAVADGARYAFSPSEVETLVDLGPAQLEQAGSGLVLRHEGRPVPIRDLAALLGGGEGDPRARPAALVLAQGGRRIAVAVDRIVGALPVLQQRLDPFLEGVVVARSVALFTDGELAVALDVGELFRRAELAPGVSVSNPVASPIETRARVHRVLVVDDSELTRDVVVSVLRDMGLEVVEAVNGQAASEILAATQPDLVVTDLDMPVVDGFELLRRIRASPARAALPVVVLSTRGSREDVQRASELGADAYLVKNRLELEQLRRVVGAQLQVRVA